MALDNRVKRFLVQTPVGGVLLMPFRFGTASATTLPN